MIPAPLVSASLHVVAPPPAKASMDNHGYLTLSVPHDAPGGSSGHVLLTFRDPAAAVRWLRRAAQSVEYAIREVEARALVGTCVNCAAPRTTKAGETTCAACRADERARCAAEAAS